MYAHLSKGPNAGEAEFSYGREFRMCLNFIKKTRFGLVTPVTIELFKGKKKKEKKKKFRRGNGEKQH